MSEEILNNVIKGIDKITETDPEGNSEDRIKQLTDMLFELRKLSEPYAAAAGMISEALAPIEAELLDHMVMNEIKSFKDSRGRGTISWNADVYQTIVDQKEFFLFLRGTGDEAVAKLQIGPDLMTDELLEKLKHSKPGEMKIGAHGNTVRAYLKNKILEAEEASTEDVRQQSEYLLDETLWPPGITMTAKDPTLKVKLGK